MTALIPTRGSAVALAGSVILAGAIAAGRLGAPPTTPLLVVAAIAMVLLSIITGRRWTSGKRHGRAARDVHRATVACLVALILMTLGMARGSSSGAAGRALLASTTHAVVGVVRDVPAMRGRQSLVVVSVDGSDESEALGATVIAPVLGPVDVLPGDRVRLDVSAIRRPDARPGPLSAAVLAHRNVDAVAVSPRLTVLSHGGPGFARAVGEVRLAASLSVELAVGEPEATTQAGIALGIHGSPARADESALQATGLIHLVATDGLKVAIVAGTFGRAVAMTAGGPATRGLVISVAVIFLSIVGGGGAPALRSTAVAIVGCGLVGRGRRLASLPFLGIITAAFLVADPGLVSDIGMQLTVLGTAGILIGVPPIRRHVPGPAWLVEPLAVTVAAQLATLPVVATTFGSISLISPLANVLAIPLVAPIAVSTWFGLIVGVAWPGLGRPGLLVGGWLTHVVLLIARGLASVPGSAFAIGTWPVAWTFLWIGALALGCGAVLACRATWGVPVVSKPASPVGSDRQRGRAGVLVAAAITGCLSVPTAIIAGVAATAPNGHLRVSVLAVGAGTAVLVRTGTGAVVLVDTGPDPAALRLALGSRLTPGFRHLDAVILTGGQRPEAGGLDGLDGTSPDHIIVGEADLGSASRAALLRRRDAGAAIDVVPSAAPFVFGGLTLRLLPLDAPASRTTVTPPFAIQFAGEGGSALVLGGATPAVQDALASFGPSLRSDLLVAPAGGALSAPLLVAVAPQCVAQPSATAPRSAVVDLPVPSVRSTAREGTLDYLAGPGGLRPA